MSSPDRSTSTPSDGSARASGQHHGLRQPDDDQRVEDALDNVGLKDSAATLEDEMRDRRGKGVRGGYDDSIDHDAADGPVSDDEVARSPRNT
jgi:hypothetical protein